MEIQVYDAPTINIDIYIAGDFGVIKHLCQKYCEVKLCVSITPVSFAFKFGQEAGAKISLINYPRFPKSLDKLQESAEYLARYLLSQLSQGSCTIVGPEDTFWLTRREGE